MQRHTFQGALEATMRVACCTALIGTVGCKPKAASVSVQEKAVQQNGGESSVARGSETEQAGELASEFPDGFDRCKAAFEEFFGAEPVAEPTEEIAECCDTYIAHNNDFGLRMDAAYRYECCSLENWTEGVFCTPWGPPTPPRMPAAIS